MQYFLFIYLFIFIGNIHSDFKCQDCTKDIALMQTQKKFKRKGFSLSQYNCEVVEDSLYYEVKYLLIEKGIDGGGGYFKISKKECKIVKEEYYQ